uniref:Hexosyltransferase n=1 Tax=Attheya septentrionalis TaxID=420275 RepID=A0A7S2URK8_9STRA|mmetsp:Transcript_7039/g.12629  ORF Transcript_7039/g.12629 Transcript_7039/m.12629 type:complete len:371 (+) Transcript_7039:192-1304(+)|eukprot:CAMPEP_0198292116 /NCGR_PEP_ID=MMETSP1449-20131203/9885_1 /TAXON_ID=420275 /ORGANISM="Attheya septentrionalis, Strain CCMP2084" /LENGTH=370 /DNA_ID=CAMNT_0043990847 /DNA_START=34 /DNA_END=1149 /DNA_ORIENTATION=-
MAPSTYVHLQTQAQASRWTQAPSLKALLAIIVVFQVVIMFRASPKPLTPIPMGNKSVLKQSHMNIPQKRRLAIASFVDGPEHLYGVFSTRTQMAKFNMSGSGGVEQVVIVPKDFHMRNKKEWNALTSWMQGPDKHIYQVDRDFIIKKIPNSSAMWKGTFNKLWMFNMTDFDRLIVLDGDILIRTNIMHWFDYPTPCATQAGGEMERNSGAMVIEPSNNHFDQMMQILPNASTYTDNTQGENWNSDYGDQGFITSFFTTSYNASERMKTMPIESAPLSSYLSREKNPMRYFKRFRPHIIETVHFTVHKLYRKGSTGSDSFLCDMFQEWFESLQGMDDNFYQEVIQFDHFQECPNATKYDQFRPSNRASTPP